MNQTPYLSVVIPLYNEATTVTTTLNSIIQQDFNGPYEIILINDGSSDNTLYTIKEYADKYSTDDVEIVITSNDTNLGISDSLNKGIAISKSDIIVRIDGDNKMLPGRLQHQYDTLQREQELGVLASSGICVQGPDKEYRIQFGNEYLSLHTFSGDTNYVIHPAVAFRKSILTDKLGQRLYESYFNNAEDMWLWVRCLEQGITIRHDSKMVTEYPMCSSVCDNTWVLSRRIGKFCRRMLYVEHEDSPQLTIIIPFKNEGDEIAYTLRNILATAKNRPDILLINDGSDDGYDYAAVANKYKCRYIHNETSLGVGEVRMQGARCTRTEFMMIIDGHMRFYDDDWDGKIVDLIRNNSLYNDILCSQTLTLWRTESEEYPGLYKIDNETGTKRNSTNCTVIKFGDRPFESPWTYKTIEDANVIEGLVKVPCIMGACYICSTEFYNRISGTEHLVNWGCDEPLLSIKTYLAGGGCYLIPDLHVGHIYRDKAPYAMLNKNLYTNTLFMVYLFCHFDTELKELYLNKLREKMSDELWNTVHENIDLKEWDFYIKNYYNRNPQSISIRDFFKMNDHALPDDGTNYV